MLGTFIGTGCITLGVILNLVLCARRGRALRKKRTEFPDAQGPESPKEICNPFDSESHVNRESWARHIDTIPAPQEPESPKEIRNPFDSEFPLNRESWAPHIDTIQSREHVSTRSNTVSTRQLYIANQVHRAREKVAELEEMSTLLRSSSNSSHENGPRLIARADHDALPVAPALHDEPVNPFSDPLQVQAKLERAILQIEGLNNRIRELEMQRRSSWALGRSHEPPPGYSE